MLRCAFFRRYSSTGYHAKYQVPGTGLYVCRLASLCFCHSIVLSRSSSCFRLASYCFFHSIVLSRYSSYLCFLFRKLHPYCRSERDVANTQKSQHKTISSAQVDLGIIKSLIALNHGPLLSDPFTFSGTLPGASVAARGAEPLS